MLSGILRDADQFQLLVDTLQGLNRQGQWRDARELLAACLKLFAACADQPGKH